MTTVPDNTATPVGHAKPLWEKVRIVTTSNLNASEKVLLITLADYAGRDGVAWPSQETLAQAASVKPRQLRNVIKSLADRNILSTTRRAGGHGTNYTINWDELTGSQLPPATDCQWQPIAVASGNGLPVPPATDCLQTYKRTDQGTEKETPNGVSCAETGQAPSSAPAGDELTEFEFPVDGKGSKSWILPKAKLEEYRTAFPHLDVTGEMRKARQWCRDNPTKRKTAKGMPAFLTRWLSNEQNSPSRANKQFTGGAGRSGPGQKYDPHAKGPGIGDI